jgi:hypothetical protein
LDEGIACARESISESDVLGWFSDCGYRLARQPL